MSARILAAFFLIIVFNILLISISLFVGFQSSKKDWNSKIREEAQYTLELLLDGVMDEYGFLNKENCTSGLINTRERLIGVAQIDIFSPDGNLLLSWTNSSLDYYTPKKVEFEYSEPYYFDGKLISYTRLYSPVFGDFEFNRRLIFKMSLLLLGGMIISAVLYLILAFRMASHFTREARNTARCLINLTRGSREIEVIPSVTSEISTINNAALSLQEKLINEESLRSRWYDSLAHELRTPVTAMKSQFIACRDGILPLTDARWETILGELAGVESLIRDFAFLSRIEGADFKPDKQCLSSDAIIEYLTASLSAQAREKNITLVWDFQSFNFNCDFSLLTTAFSQLIANAVQHSPEFSEILIGLEIESEIGVFRVINTGHLEEDSLEQLFHSLYKADSSRRENGSGLGLTIAHRISQILGARLNVKNLEDRKICFEMALLSCSSTVSA